MACSSSLATASWRWYRREPLRRRSKSGSRLQMLARAAAMELSSSPTNAASRSTGRLWRGIRQGTSSLLSDAQEWGIGVEPIFTVVVSPDGRLRVEVDEEEICGRCRLQSMVSRRKIVAADRIAKAQKLAEDIESGLIQPPTASAVFRFVKDGSQKQVTLVGDAKLFLEKNGWTIGGGLLLGLVIAVASFVVLQMKSRSNKQQAVEQQSTPPQSPPSCRPVHNTERLLAIRGMARQAMDEEAARGPKEIDEQMQNGAAVRVKVAKKRTKEQAPGDLVGSGLNGNSLEHPVEEGTETQVRPRIILSTKEAAELLAGRRRRSVQRQPALDGDVTVAATVAKVEPAAPSSNHSYQQPDAPETLPDSSFASDKHMDSGGRQQDVKWYALEQKQENSGLQVHKDVSRDTSNVSQKPFQSFNKQQQQISLEVQVDQSSLERAQDGGYSMAQKRHASMLRPNIRILETAESSNDLDNAPTEDLANSPIEVETVDWDGRSLDEEGAMSCKSSTTNQALSGAVEKNAVNSFGEVACGNLDLTVSAPNSAVAASAVKEFLSKGKGQPAESGEKVISRTVTACNADLSVSQEPAPKNPKKVWPKDLQRRYERESDPSMRALMREIGKDLQEWIPEEKVEEAVSLFYKGPDGQRELLRRWQEDIARQRGLKATKFDEKKVERMLKRCALIQERMQNWTNRFGPQALRNKYRDYNPRKPDYYWWFDLPYVACLDLRNEKEGAKGGLYSMDMADEDKQREARVHVIGFEEQHDALNFSRILVPELEESFGKTDVAIIPFEPKEIFREAAAAGYKVTVIKKGQLQMFAGQPLYEVEHKIRVIGRDYYLQEEMRARSIDISAVLEDLGRSV